MPPDYSIPTIRRVIAEALRPLDLRVWDHVPDQVEPPAAVVGLKTINYDGAMGRGHDELVFTVTVIASHGSARQGQRTLDDLMDKLGAGSVKGAIEADAAVKAAVQTYRVTGLTRYGPVDYAGTTFYAAEFEIEVFS